MTIATMVVNSTIRRISRIVCRVDDKQLVRIPLKGPLILIGNHINFLDVPLVITHLQPRQVTGFVKSETWDNPVFRILFNMWKTIPIRRGEADREAFRQAMEALEQNKIVAIAPEGTRSGSGRLLKGHPGAVLLAVKSGVPVLPFAFYGSEHIWSNLRRLSRTDFRIVVGNPFHIELGQHRLDRETRDQITAEMMYQIAALLPTYYRGYYSDLQNATEEFLRFDPGVESNLLKAKK